MEKLLKMSVVKRFFLFGCFFFSSVQVASVAEAREQKSYHFAGYVKSFAVWQDEFSALPNDPAFQSLASDHYWESQNAVRFMVDGVIEDNSTWSLFNNLSYELHYELQPVLRSQDLSNDSAAQLSLLRSFAISGDRYRVSNPDATIGNGDGKSAYYQNLDRFNLQWTLDKGDLTIGRQAIALGAARSVNPTDLFLPYSITTLNTEYRQGVDALRYQHALGELSELDVGFVGGHHLRDNGAWLQLQFPYGATDISLIGVRANEDWLVGGGLQSAVGDSGVWLEVAQLRGETPTFNRVTLGMDRSLRDDLFFQFEFHFSGAGVEEANQILFLANSTPWTEHGLFLLGKRYFMPAINWQVSPLISSNIQWLLNMDDDSHLATARVEVGATEDLYFDFGLFIYSGDGLDSPLPGLLIPQSEFGLGRDSVFAAARYYF